MKFCAFPLSLAPFKLKLPCLQVCMTLVILDIYKFQLAILMYQHHTRTLPHIFKAYFVTHEETHSYNTRHKLNYRYEVARTNVRYFSVKIAGPKLWNFISASIRESHSQTTFKNACKSFVLDLY